MGDKKVKQVGCKTEWEKSVNKANAIRGLKGNKNYSTRNGGGALEQSFIVSWPQWFVIMRIRQ